MSQINVIHAAVIGLTATFLLLAFDRAGELRKDQYVYVPPAPKNPYDWQRWTAAVKLPNEGYYEIWTRATDSRGVMQPHVAGNWNPQGYGANPINRIRVLVES